MQGLAELPGIQAALAEKERSKIGADSPNVVLGSGVTLENVALTVQSVTLDQGSFNEESCKTLDFSVFESLRDVVICNDVGYHVKKVVFAGLKHLKRILVKENCFTQFKSHHEGSVKQRQARLRIADCDVLKSIEIGAFSFADFGFFSFTGGGVEAFQQQSCRHCGIWRSARWARIRTVSIMRSLMRSVRLVACLKGRSAVAEGGGGGRLLLRGGAALPV